MAHDPLIVPQDPNCICGSGYNEACVIHGLDALVRWDPPELRRDAFMADDLLLVECAKLRCQVCLRDIEWDEPQTCPAPKCCGKYMAPVNEG